MRSRRGIKVRLLLPPTVALLVWGLGLTWAVMASGAWSGDRSIVVWQAGPKTVKFKYTAGLQMPAGFRFADAHSTMRVLEAAGQPVSKREMGMITSEDASDWAIIFAFSEIGHLSESGASGLEPNELLKKVNAQIESANQERKKSGKPLLGKAAWEQKPAYRASNQSLEWALRSETLTRTNIEYHLDFLGRQGVMEAKWSCDAETFAAHSSAVKEMLASFSFFAGQKYGDATFKSKVATGRLEGLITGETVKEAGKLGFWATLLLILKTIFRLIVKLLILAVIIGVVLAGYFFYKLYSGGRGKKDEVVAE